MWAQLAGRKCGGKDFGQVLFLAKAAELLDFVDTPKNAIVLTDFGKRFIQGDVHDFAWTADNHYAKPVEGFYEGAGSPYVINTASGKVSDLLSAINSITGGTSSISGGAITINTPNAAGFSMSALASVKRLIGRGL